MKKENTEVKAKHKKKGRKSGKDKAKEFLSSLDKFDFTKKRTAKEEARRRIQRKQKKKESTKEEGEEWEAVEGDEERSVRKVGRPRGRGGSHRSKGRGGVTKRKPGRPRGSKNRNRKKKFIRNSSSSVDSEEENNEWTDSQENEIQKRSQKRRKSCKSSKRVSKRRRGRKVVKRVDRARRGLEAIKRRKRLAREKKQKEDEAEAEKISKSKSKVKVKVKRKRKSKMHPIETDSGEEFSIEGQEEEPIEEDQFKENRSNEIKAQKVGRRRGRRKKKTISESESEETSEKESEDKEESEEKVKLGKRRKLASQKPVKRRRRLRKSRQMSQHEEQPAKSKKRVKRAKPAKSRKRKTRKQSASQNENEDMSSEDVLDQKEKRESTSVGKIEEESGSEMKTSSELDEEGNDLKIEEEGASDSEKEKIDLKRTKANRKKVESDDSEKSLVTRQRKTRSISTLKKRKTKKSSCSKQSKKQKIKRTKSIPKRQKKKRDSRPIRRKKQKSRRKRLPSTDSEHESQIEGLVETDRESQSEKETIDLEMEIEKESSNDDALLENNQITPQTNGKNQSRQAEVQENEAKSQSEGSFEEDSQLSENNVTGNHLVNQAHLAENPGRGGKAKSGLAEVNEAGRVDKHKTEQTGEEEEEDSVDVGNDGFVESKNDGYPENESEVSKDLDNRNILNDLSHHGEQGNFSNRSNRISGKDDLVEEDVHPPLSPDKTERYEMAKTDDPSKPQKPETVNHAQNTLNSSQFDSKSEFQDSGADDSEDENNQTKKKNGLQSVAESAEEEKDEEQTSRILEYLDKDKDETIPDTKILKELEADDPASEEKDENDMSGMGHSSFHQSKEAEVNTVGVSDLGNGGNFSDQNADLNFGMASSNEKPGVKRGSKQYQERCTGEINRKIGEDGETGSNKYSKMKTRKKNELEPLDMDEDENQRRSQARRKRLRKGFRDVER